MERWRGGEVKREMDEPEMAASSSSLIVGAEDQNDGDVTLAQLANPPKHCKPSSKGKTNKAKEKNDALLKVKKRLSDWKIKHAVSGPSGHFMSFEENNAAKDGLCLPGESKSSAVIRAVEVRASMDKEFPGFVKSLVRSHVASCFWMGLPAAFCKLYLPDKDTTITLEDESGKQYFTKYLAYKTGLSAGWRQFCVAQKLLEGDVLVFQLVEPTKFKAYVVRANDINEVDGALGLLNLDSYTKQNYSEKQAGQKGKTASNNNVDRKRTKSLPQSVLQKKNKVHDPRSAPNRTAGQSENDGEEVSSDVSEGLISSGPTTIPFEDIKSYDDFRITIDGLSIDSEFPTDIRKKYYKLCCSQNGFLHDNMIRGINHMLIVGITSETVKIADSIKRSKINTSREEFTAWDKTLRGFQVFGVNVVFLRTRLRRLVSLAYESEDAVEVRRYIGAKSEQTRAGNEIKNIEHKLFELKEACNRFGASIENLKSKAETTEHKFQEEVTSSPW